MPDEERRQRGELLAGEAAFQGAQIAPKPTADERGCFKGLPEADGGELVERLAVVRRGGKLQMELPRFSCRHAFEQGCVVLLHVAQMREQDLREGIAILEPKEPRKTIEDLAIAGKRLGLLVGKHLKAVLHRA